MTVDIAKLRDLLASATPAPWSYDPGLGGWVTGDDDLGVCEAIGHSDADGAGWRSSGERDANAALIAQLVTSAPELLDEIESLNAREAELRAASETAIAAEIVAKIGPDVVAELERLRRLEAAVLATCTVVRAPFGMDTVVLPTWSYQTALIAAISEARAARAKAGG